MVIYYCLEEDAEVSVDIYEGDSASGSSDVELLDYTEQEQGCHWITWDVTENDDDGGQNFTADMVLSRAGQDTDVFRNDGSDANSADLNDFFVLEEDASTRLGIAVSYTHLTLPTNREV